MVLRVVVRKAILVDMAPSWAKVMAMAVAAARKEMSCALLLSIGSKEIKSALDHSHNIKV
jgi:hypothetical protein